MSDLHICDTTNGDLRETIIRVLEKAERGSRELDEEVLLGCGWSYRLVWDSDEAAAKVPMTGNWYWFRPDGEPDAHCGSTPAVTTSVDDALKLLPVDHVWSAASSNLCNPFDRRPHCRLDKDRRFVCDSYASTVPLAFCATVLKAMRRE